MKRLSKYSLGIGDRFALQGIFQLEAIREAFTMGAEITPVWNKSFREHKMTGSDPGDVRKEADLAVQALGWERSYFVDADHIREDTVENFISSSDFFTIDVADKIGIPPAPDEIEKFILDHEQLIGDILIEGIEKPLEVTRDVLVHILNKFLVAIDQTGRIYRKIKRI